jgi:hypothetical protein
MSQKDSVKVELKPRCGVIMPISAIENYSDLHWIDVREILYETIEEAGFEPNLVSDSDEVGIIQKRIIQNLYENPIVVCDVSAKNPNVMFELGLRLAFDKPTIIIKDNITTYSFDTSPIEHLTYPRDLRFNQIVEFKGDLIEKIKATHTRASKDPEYTTFLKHFGNFTIAKIDTQEISTSAYILEELQNLRKTVAEMKTTTQTVVAKAVKRSKVLCLPKSTPEQNQLILNLIKSFGEFTTQKRGGNHYHFDSHNADNLNWDEVLKQAKTIIPSARII